MNVEVIKNFIELLQVHVKTPCLSGFQDSMQLLDFLRNFEDDGLKQLPLKSLKNKIHQNIISYFRIVTAAHFNISKGYNSGGYSSAGGYFSQGYESSESNSKEPKMPALPIDIASKIIDQSQSFELLSLLL